MAVVVNLIGGAAVFADLVGDAPWAAKVGAILVMTTSICSLALRWTEKARFWGVQRAKYSQLKERYHQIGGEMTQEQLDGLKAKVAALEGDGDEGDTRQALMAICHNEECGDRNVGEEYKISLNWYQRRLANFVDLPPAV